MTKTFADLMRNARSLVAGQRLEEATAAIQEALGRAKPLHGDAPHGGPTLDLKANGGDRHPAPSSLTERFAPFLAARPRFPMPKGRETAPLDLPEGASFEAHHYLGPAGGRAYRLYVPAALPPGPRPLLLMLHGCTQNPDDFARGTRMNALVEESGLLVAYPEQSQSANARHCWNWFEPAHQRHGSGEPAILAGILAEIAARHAVDGGRIFVAGLSAGGAMAAVMGATYPDLFAGVGVHSGLPYGAATDVGSALSLMRSGQGGAQAALPGGRMPPLIVFHGDADRTVHPANGEAVAGPALAGDVDERGSAGGRAFTRRRREASGRSGALEAWSVEGLGHAWSGGDEAGTYADPTGPDASREMVRFFLEATRQ